ncbi:MAG: sialidase, partial [Myxococcales bacterium]|nr:sialidase [Myxococcales bacterium]
DERNRVGGGPGDPGGGGLCGVDNNCDGNVDERNPGGGGPCDTGGVGQCGVGVLNCTDGALTCGPVFAQQAEVCDGLDNDCDGTADEGNPGGNVDCDTGEQGICASGTLNCEGGNLRCVRNANDLQPESCDGLDNDCDGRVDENIAIVGRPCETGNPGACQTGVFACNAGTQVCVPDHAPLPEICNALDDDCDGSTDEGNPGGDNFCQIPGRLGKCGSGLSACVDGRVQCIGENDPQPEFCDGFDNDCDGQLDEGQLAGVGDDC